MQIKILELIEGAKQARGLTVIIDVFRAFSMECYMYDKGALAIYPVGDINEAYRLKKEDESRILVGERGGAICEGFDYGNSPSQIRNVNLTGKTIIHTTSAGTQGIANAKQAKEIITGSLVNAKSIASYIKRIAPEEVSLVCMGNGGVARANEDILCAEYIQSLLTKKPFDIESRIQRLRVDGGEHFFLSDRQEVFPQEDFWMCTRYDIFPFILKVKADEYGKNIVVKEEIIFDQ